MAKKKDTQKTKIRISHEGDHVSLQVSQLSSKLQAKLMLKQLEEEQADDQPLAK